MHEERGQTWITLLIIGILLFGAVGAYIFYKFEGEGFYDKKSGTSLNETTSRSNTNRTFSNSGNSSQQGCSLSWAQWEKNGVEILSANSGDAVLLATYAERCSGKSVSVKVYKENGNSDSLVKSFSLNVVGNLAQTSMNIDSNFVNGSKYYFVSSLTGDSNSKVESSELTISNGIFTPNTIRDPLLCNGYGDDRDYLYNVDVNVFTKSNGRQSFIATLDGKTLRTNVTGEDRFYVDNSNGALQISYSINKDCGGVDIVYTVNNPTSQAQALPDLIFGGVQQMKNNPQYLDLKRGGMLTAAGTATSFYSEYWPSGFVYSPITMAVTNDLSQGTSIQYPFLDYKVETIPQMSWAADGSIVHRYVLVYPSSSGPKNGVVPANTQQTYTLSLRFAPSRNWLLTLDPYKKYFLSKYGSVQDKTPKDLRPIAGVSEAYEEYVNSTNPRGYVPWYTGSLLNEVGWNSEVTRIINHLNDKGYKRLMLWQTAGTYDPKVCIGCNFPAQAMNWLPKLVETQGELNRIKQAGIKLGFWWGRSSQVVVPDVWPPASLASIINANYSDSAHHSYLSNQFNLIRQRGADSIGLDSFTWMEPYGRYKWLEEMQGISSSTEYIQEHGGADIFHARSANFYTDSYSDSAGKWTVSLGPSILSWYINPNSEVWMYAPATSSQLNKLGEAGMKAHGEQLTKWGYTYVDNGVYVDVKNWDLSVSECLDGKDNDGNGVVDWPKDNSCENEFDESER